MDVLTEAKFDVSNRITCKVKLNINTKSVEFVQNFFFQTFEIHSRLAKMEEKVEEKKPKEEKPKFVARTPTDIQRIKLERLMKNPV